MGGAWAAAFDLPWTLMTSVLERHGGTQRGVGFQRTTEEYFWRLGPITKANVCSSKWVARICVSLGTTFAKSRKMCSFLPHEPS